LKPINPKFLLTAGDLQQEFAALLNRADSVKIAAAWATLGIQIEMLENARIPTEVVVGKAFNLTHPDAIESMRSLGKVYVDERTDKQGLFHPKFYLFKMGDQYTGRFQVPSATGE